MKEKQNTTQRLGANYTCVSETYIECGIHHSLRTSSFLNLSASSWVTWTRWSIFDLKVKIKEIKISNLHLEKDNKIPYSSKVTKVHNG